MAKVGLIINAPGSKKSDNDPIVLDDDGKKIQEKLYPGEERYSDPVPFEDIDYKWILD